jgi:UDP-glucose 4-epimerase
MLKPSPVWVVAGATGRVGRMLMRHWQQITPSAIRVLPQQRNAQIDTSASDVLVWSPLEGATPLCDRATKEGPIAGVIVLSGVTMTSPGDLADNVTLARAMVSAARAAGIPRLIFASTSAVYGAGKGAPITEDFPPSPINDYGRAKRAAEEVFEFANGNGLEVCQLRIGNVVGADALLMNAAHATPENRLQLDRFPDGGGPRRSYIGPVSLAKVIERLAEMQEPLPMYLNIGAPLPISMENLANAAGVPWNFVTAPPTAHQHITLDCSRLSTFYQFSAEASDPQSMVAEWHQLSKQS